MSSCAIFLCVSLLAAAPANPYAPTAANVSKEAALAAETMRPAKPRTSPPDKLGRPIPFVVKNYGIQQVHDIFRVHAVDQKGAHETHDKLLEIIAELKADYTATNSGIVLKPSLTTCGVMEGAIYQAPNPHELLFYTFYVKTSREHNWGKGDTVYIFTVPDAPHSARDGAGKEYFVNGYIEAGFEPDATEQQLLDALHKGKTFPVHIIEERDPVKKDLPGTRGLSKFPTDVVYTVSW